MIYKKKQAQITIEYLLFVGMIILVLLFLINRKDSKFKTGVEDYVVDTQQSVLNLIDHAACSGLSGADLTACCSGKTGDELRRCTAGL